MGGGGEGGVGVGICLIVFCWGIGATFCTRQEIQCFPYAGSLVWSSLRKNNFILGEVR